ncbi:hypothetical protein R7127_23380 [Vibrio sp. 1159]|uniref:hypothetical protein n=1 Tax=Vibrio sp. 1159 TaxID=3074545 RepID=UPI002964613C|nr:hypothetical protein [Vibrio sp. 1159]MDW2323212.1 hypothetical protein [Vibrio sp. 1159]
MFKIADFGNDTECANGEELMASLRGKYAGKSVSIHYRRNSGITWTKFVDVSTEGHVTDSYKGNDFNLADVLEKATS